MYGNNTAHYARLAANQNKRQAAAGGVTVASGMSLLWEPIVIFAIDAASNGKDERQALLGVMQFKKWCADKALGCKEVVGCYGGKREPAFVMALADFEAQEVGRIWCAGQESILRLSRCHGPAEPHAGRRIATLVYTNGTEVELGEWRRVNTTEAFDRDSWTYDPEPIDGGYWVAGEGGKFGPSHERTAEPDPNAPAPEPIETMLGPVRLDGSVVVGCRFGSLEAARSWIGAQLRT